MVGSVGDAWSPGLGEEARRKGSLPVLVSFRHLEEEDSAGVDSVDLARPAPARRPSLYHSLSLASLLPRHGRLKVGRARALSTDMISPPLPASWSGTLPLALTTTPPRKAGVTYSSSPIYQTRSRKKNPIYQNLRETAEPTSPIYQNIPSRVADEIARFEQDFLTPLLVEEVEEGIYDEVKPEEEDDVPGKACLSSSSSLASDIDSGAFSRLSSSPDCSLQSGEDPSSPGPSSSPLPDTSALVRLDREQMALLYSLSSLSTGEGDEHSPHSEPGCRGEVTVNGVCYQCRQCN